MNEFDLKLYIRELLCRAMAALRDNKPVVAYEYINEVIEWLDAKIKKEKEAEQ